MYGRWEGELWFHRWHMWPVPSSSTPSVAAPSNSFVFIDTNSFSKDGRKIHVGDSALFKPPHNSLPFVGRIRKLIVGKDNSFSLSVNWLYRPADVKLKEGALLEAAPNEVFYSFHKDEIPAASLLHPCKVKFLRKGVELPSGTSSFVCRRVYDIESKRLWWLTDKDYINSYLTQERQEEVNQLLDKTHIDMYGAAQTGGRSPKPLNGAAQVKHSSDNVQNSSSSISSHSKSRKREHGGHISDSVKRERLSKVDDADSGQRRPEHIMKAEIAKITDKGGLVDIGGVEKLIKLMRPETPEKKLDLACRTMLVDVISATDRLDCLGRFVQLRGLLVLDEWLQEIHKGKIGDGSPKENDKSVEEFLFSLLRALDRLPVNLHALRTCNVGKSVNHLRSHKNSKIQKTARSLVSTWKRRVEAEMNILETKSSTSRGGSWANKAMVSEVSPVGGRRIGGSSEAGPKSTTPQPSAAKAQQTKQTEAATKSPTSPASAKLPTVGAGSSEMPSSGNKDGRSCSSSQSPNNSQSCSSDHGKPAASCSVSHSRNSTNGFHGSTIPGVQKDTNIGKVGSVNRNVASEKGSPTTHTSDMSLVDNGNSSRLIVRLPNTCRSPARTGSGESPEDSSTVSNKGSLPVKHDHKVNTKVDEVKVGTDLSPAKEVKAAAAGGERMTEASLGSGSSSGVTPKPGKLYEPSYSSINALVESCAKFSEASVSPSVGDDVGMNLLASVAAGEMSRSEVSPVCSPASNSPLPEDSCSVNVAKLRQKAQDGGRTEDNISMANGHVPGDCKDANFGSEAKKGEDNQDLPQNGNDVNAPDVTPAVASADDKVTKDNVAQPDASAKVVETQVNEESASWSSSDMQEIEKALVQKRSSSSDLATTSCGDDELPPTCEEAVDKKQSERQNMDTGTSVSIERVTQENIERNEALDKPSSDGMQESRATEKAEMAVKLDFDLNEVLSDDGIQGEVEKSCPIPETSAAVHTPAPLPSSNSPVIGNKPVSITVAAAAKGPFYPSENLSRGKVELGWKGSAATSAFRPAEPRKHIETSDNSKPGRPLFDFDLNVGVVDDAPQNNAPLNRAVSGGELDLDLNACEETPEVVHLSASRQQRSLVSEPNSSRGFDLNGPGVEEAGGDSVQLSRNGLQFMSGVPNVRVNNNNMEMGNFTSWFPQTNTYPAISIPSVLPGRGEQNYPFVPAASSQRMLTPVSATTSLNPEMFRGPVLSSSPAVAFPSTMPFQYSAFPFETNFSMPSISNSFSAVSTPYVDSTSSGGPLVFPTISSQAQLVGPNGVVSMPYRPYFMGLPGGSSNVVGPDGRKWGGQGLDLNAGPGNGTADDKLPPALRQMPISGSQGLSDEQLKMFQQMAAGSGVSKRKEPEGGWDGDRISYKHPSWQ